jgi:hypothetical protein
MIRKLALGSMSGLLLVLSACTPNDIQDVPPLTLEEVAGKRLAQMTNDEKEGLIYQFVSDRITVDKEKLISIEKEDVGKITELLTKVNNTLKGGDEKALKDEYANYLLMEFARTPYEWKQSKVDAVGFDPAARLYFVDVTYSTTSTFKKAVPASKIANGSPDEEVLKEQRYADYLAYLTKKQNGEDANALLKAFEKSWGSLANIMQEQQGVSLLDRTRLEGQSTGGLGKLTYTGLIQDSKMNSGATMTFRYVFKYNFNLGEETDLEVDSLYLKDYQLGNPESIIGSLTQADTNGVEVLKPFIDKLAISYHKAVAESNDTGLHSLFYDYAGVDKYYDDINKYTYNYIGGYNFEILQRTGTNVVIKVNRINKIRAKGAEMSLPTYDETLIYNLVLGKDDKIKIRSVNLLKSTLVGEPISVIKNVNGISDLIQYSGDSFTAENKEKVEKALKDFSTVVFNGKVDDAGFTDIVDIGVSEVALKKISDIVVAVPDADRKVTYIVSWDTKTNVYVSLTIREIFEKGKQNLDTEAVVDLVNRNGEWKVVNYTRTMNIKSSGVKLDAKNALTEDIR